MLAFAGLCLSGCATVMVSGYKLNAERWETDSSQIRRNAAFDLQCEPSQLSLTPLLSEPATTAEQCQDLMAGCWSYQVAVTGCGRRERYRRTENADWVKG